LSRTDAFSSGTAACTIGIKIHEPAPVNRSRVIARLKSTSPDTFSGNSKTDHRCRSVTEFGCTGTNVANEYISNRHVSGFTRSSCPKSLMIKFSFPFLLFGPVCISFDIIFYLFSTFPLSGFAFPLQRSWPHSWRDLDLLTVYFKAPAVFILFHSLKETLPASRTPLPSRDERLADFQTQPRVLRHERV